MVADMTWIIRELEMTFRKLCKCLLELFTLCFSFLFLFFWWGEKSCIKTHPLVLLSTSMNHSSYLRVYN